MNKKEFKDAYRMARVIYRGMSTNGKVFTGRGDLRFRCKSVMAPLFGDKLGNFFADILVGSNARLNNRLMAFKRPSNRFTPAFVVTAA